MAAGVDLRDAAAMLPCLGEPAEASLASRLYFLFGIAQQASGHADFAREDFVRAMLFAPGLTWDERFAPDLRAPFDLAATDLATRARVPVVAGDASLWIDGRPAGADVPAGAHLVQVLKPTLTTHDVHASSPLVVVTAPGLRAAMADPGANAVLLDAALADRGDALVVADGKAWRDGQWVSAPRRSSLRPTLIGAGLGTLAVGAVTFAAGEAVAFKAAGETTAADYTYRTGRQDVALLFATGGAVAAGVGAALTAAGLLQPGPVQLSGAGVSVAW
jgi:hypothetical protein